MMCVCLSGAQSDAPPRSIDSIVARFPRCTPNSLRSDQCNFCRLLTSQTCRTIAEVKTGDRRHCSSLESRRDTAPRIGSVLLAVSAVASNPPPETRLDVNYERFSY